MVRLVGGERHEHPGAGGERAEQGVESDGLVALADVRTVGVVDEDLLGPEQVAGAGVLGPARPVRLDGRAESAEGVPPRDREAGGRGAAVDGDHGEGAGQGGQQSREGEGGVVEVR